MLQGNDQWGNGKILLLPTVIVNKHQYRGRLDVPSILRALCAGFSESTEPEVGHPLAIAALKSSSVALPCATLLIHSSQMCMIVVALYIWELLQCISALCRVHIWAERFQHPASADAL